GGATGAELEISAAAAEAGATLLVEDVEALSAAAQKRLLDACDRVRVIATTSSDPAEEARLGRLHSELFRRLSATSVSVPPLRDRQRDLVTLARAFVREASERRGVLAAA